MARTGLIVLGAVLSMVPYGGAQDDSGAFVAGFYGSGGSAGGVGVYIGAYSTRDFGKRAILEGLGNGGAVLELGLMGPVQKNPVDGIFSLNYQQIWNLRRKRTWRGDKKFLFLQGGYSRLFAKGNGVNYGAGVIWRYGGREESDMKELRFEYREVYLPGWSRQPGFRLSFERASADL